MLTQKGQSSGDGSTLSTYTVQSAESGGAGERWGAFTMALLIINGKFRGQEEGQWGWQEASQGELCKVGVWPFRWPEPKWSSRGQLEVRGSAGPYKLVPTEAENHQLSPSFNMLALFFILQVNYQLTCSLISPSKQNEGFLLKNMIKLIFLSVW